MNSRSVTLTMYSEEEKKQWLPRGQRSPENSPEKSPEKNEKQPSRVSFVSRVSPLTELQAHDELKSAYGLLISLYVAFTTVTVVNYFLDPEWGQVDLNFLSDQLSTLIYALGVWMALHAIGYFVIFPVTCLMYNKCPYYSSCLCLIMVSFALCIILPPLVIIHAHVQFLLSFILVIEQIRLLMKYVSFVVENTRNDREEIMKHYLCSFRPRTSGCLSLTDDKNNKGNDNSSSNSNSNNNNNNSSSSSKKSEKSPTSNSKSQYDARDEGEKNCLSVISSPEVTSNPTIGKFSYFLFAPTLIYRPCYPKLSGGVNVSLAVMYFAEFFAFWFLGLQLLTKFLMPTFRSTGLEAFKASNLTMDFFKMGLCASVCFFGLGYGFLHSWLNGWAELMRFADRQFYREWWLSDSVSQFWRRWNFLVHLWLSEYVYSPMMKMTRGNQAISSGGVYLVSALAHEYATGFSLRIFLPVFACVMFCSFPLTYLIHFSPKQNKVLVITLLHSLLWFSITSVLLGYSLEIFSRNNCPSVVQSTWMDVFVPRFPSCVSIVY